MEKENVKTQGGIGFVGLLTIALIVLKLCGVIDWSWWVVILGPFLCSLAFAVVIISVTVAVLWFLADHKKNLLK